MGFNCTATILPEDTARFLFWYKGNSLQEVMDTEIKARYQQAGARTAANTPMETLRGDKQKIVDAIETDIVPFFKQRGITITTVGQFGGIVYQDKDIAERIEEVYKAQQLQELAYAKLQAQTNINLQIQLEAQAQATARETAAKAEAEAVFLKFDGEARGIKALNKALAEANNNPDLVKLRALEVEKVKVEKWGGQVPSFYITGGGGSSGDQNGFPTVILDTRSGSEKR